MDQPSDEYVGVRELRSPVGPFRYVATPRVWVANTDGSKRQVSLGERYGRTADEAEARAETVLEAWRRRGVRT